MALVRFNQNSFFPRLENLLEDFFNTDFMPMRSWNFSATNTTVPAVNIKENGDNFMIEMAAPGMDKEDFKISLEDNVLTITSEKQEEKKEETDKYTRREFAYRSFQRAFNMPESADSDKIEAKYEKGILFITIPKKEEAKAKPAKQIAIA